jgi:secondary thiamine-phosphate synthase enzyme
VVSFRFDTKANQRYFNRAVCRERAGSLHNDEDPDVLPAHIKSGILGASLTIPISNSKLRLRTWQGIYLCEHRTMGGNRNLATLHGE